MKNVLCITVAAMAMASCSSDGLVSNQGTGGTSDEMPIAFTVNKRNITRAEPSSLESKFHYNFGVWAYKTTSSASQQVMNNYLVGYSDGAGKGYDKTNATTWASGAGSESDHTSPWFYEKLGNAEYLNEDASKGYTKTQADFMSANVNQYLRYWDLAYTNTNFYAYAPYRASDVTFDEDTKMITVAPSANTAAYNDPMLHEFIYAGAQATNKEVKDVRLQFKHLGAQVKLQFYEDVPGYTVKLVDESATVKGIQATPAVKSGTTYTKSTYYTSCGATLDYTTPGAPTIKELNHTGAVTTGDNLKFDIPTDVVPAYDKNGTQTYAPSATDYYAVAQPFGSTTGFTFHVSYELEAEDNHEKIIVHDARVFVPANMVTWEPNKRYIYNFKFTTNSTGTTDPQGTIDYTDPTVPATSTVYPIVFDGATIEEYENVNKSVEQ